MNHPRPWRLGAVAAAIALAGTFASLQVQALGLGRVTVQSALGEPLRAEIDIPEINAEEAASLRASVASPDAFKAAGLEYSAAVTNMQISLQRRPDGRSYLRLSSDRPVSEPFVDLILEARWASGRIVRDYTMLFDPPNLRAAA
ncbi:MAG: fimbrial protein FimV, partial [Polaromonas sp.]|nr:fimbrial protein FimV [Polaromonas sp.]